MRAPPGHVEPITADRLHKIIKCLGYCPPSDAKLVVLAAVLTGMQSCNLPDDWGRDFFTRVEDVKGGPARVDKVPPWLRLTFDADKRALGHPRPGMKHKWPIGHPRHGEKDWRKKDWRDLARNIGPRVRQMMIAANPGRQRFGYRDGPVTGFIVEVIPLVFPDQESTVDAVGQYLARVLSEKRDCNF
jgi:hypothetical protein